MNLEQLIEQINFVWEQDDKLPQKKSQLHELAWQLVNKPREE